VSYMQSERMRDVVDEELVDLLGPFKCW